MNKKIKSPSTGRIWELYQNGLDAHALLNLLNTIAENERFYANDQWHGVVAPDLPKPTMNFIAKAVDFKIEAVSSSDAKVQFVANSLPSDVVTPDVVEQNNLQVLKKAQYIQDLQQDPHALPPDNSVISSEADAQLITAMFELDWERLRMRDICDKGMLDACISGNMILYNFWDAKVKDKQLSEGAVSVRLIDVVNFFPTDMQEQDIQLQPSIIVSQRELVSKVKAEAESYGAKSDDLDQITYDSDNYNNAGDMSKKEVQDDDAKKIATLLYFWRDEKSGHIFAVKTTHNVVVRPAWDTLLTRYPFASMPWKLRKNSFYGRSEIEGIIPNQKAINKALAMMLLSVTLTAYPRVLYSQGQINKWNNNISEAIPVNGDINSAVKYLMPPSMSNDAFQLPEIIMKNTLDMVGANEAALGSAPAYNASANALMVNQAMTPIATIQRRYYAMLKEFSLNWIDMVFGYMDAPRWVFPHDDDGNTFPFSFEPDKLRKRIWNVAVEVGKAPEFSYATWLKQLGDWLQSGQMQFQDYLQAVPENMFPGKQKVLGTVMERIRKANEQAMQMAQAKIQGLSQPPQLPQIGGQENVQA
jgi:hypothetical protein